MALQRDGDESRVVDALGDPKRLDAAGIDLRGYRGAEIAADVVALRTALGLRSWNLYGISWSTRTMLDALWQIITGRRSVRELGGPLKIAQVAGQQATLGLVAFVSLVALLSINLGFINLLPVPMLDGGHLLFYAIEAARGRPVSVRSQEWAFRGGLALLLALLLFTTVNDLGSLGLW